MIIALLFCIMNTMIAFADNHISIYMPYINSPSLGLDMDAVEQLYKENGNEDKVAFGLILFRRALIGGREDEVKEAFDYWASLYEDSTYKNPLTLAYVGTLEAMYAGAADIGGIKKIRLVKAGAKKLYQAQKEISTMNDSLAYGYVLFLTGNTFSNLPTFFKEFKKQTLPNLYDAKKQYTKAFKSLGEDEAFMPMQYSLYASLYNGYGRWYEKSKKMSKANSYYKASKKYDLKYETIIKEAMKKEAKSEMMEQETMEKKEQ